jgi:hypothetical protein
MEDTANNNFLEELRSPRKTGRQALLVPAVLAVVVLRVLRVSVVKQLQFSSLFTRTAPASGER